MKRKKIIFWLGSIKPNEQQERSIMFRKPKEKDFPTLHDFWAAEEKWEKQRDYVFRVVIGALTIAASIGTMLICILRSMAVH